MGDMYIKQSIWVQRLRRSEVSGYCLALRKGSCFFKPLINIDRWEWEVWWRNWFLLSRSELWKNVVAEYGGTDMGWGSVSGARRLNFWKEKWHNESAMLLWESELLRGLTGVGLRLVWICAWIAWWRGNEADLYLIFLRTLGAKKKQTISNAVAARFIGGASSGKSWISSG